MLMEHERIAIAGDDELGLGRARTGKHVIIVGITADRYR